MSISSTVSERLKIADKIMEQTLEESKKLMTEAKSIHDQATDKIKAYLNKKSMSDIEKRELAELITAQQEAEKAYFMLNHLINGN